MNKKVAFGNLGGMPLDQDLLQYMQESYVDALAALSRVCGDKVILTGVITTGSITSAGWIVYDGEIIPFAGGANATGVIVEEQLISLPFENGTSRPVQITKSARFGSPATFLFSELKRLNTLISVQERLTEAEQELEEHTHSFSTLTSNPFISFGSFPIGDVPASDGFWTVSIPEQADNQYKVFGVLRAVGTNLNNENDVSYVVGNFTANSFQLGLREYSPVAQNLIFDFMILRY